MTLNSPYAPSNKVMREVVEAMTTIDEKLAYLSEIASNDYSCPDACDEWALKWLEDEDLA